MKDALVRNVVNYAEFLIQCAEPVKALTFLDNATPVFLKEHPEVVQIRALIRDKVAHYFDDEVYVKRYSEYTNGMQGDFVPFCDPNLLNLDRTKFALNQAIEKQPRHVLSVGGGEGTLAKEILTNTTAHLSVSELQEGRSAVVEALDLIFPGRVGTVERFDVEKNDVQQFDFIECLEVIEHVSDPVLLLTNLLTSLEVGGILCLTTPNAEEWVEQKNLDDLYTEGAWLHHVNAFTQETLVWCVQRAVKRINAHDYSMEFHPGHKQIMAKIVRTK